MDDVSLAAQHLARNMHMLRQQKNLSQQRLSELAEIPRSTLTHIESGAGNPSLGNLCRLATALGVGIEELLARPREQITLVKAAEVPTLERAAGRARLHKLMPDKIRGIDIDRLELDANASMGGRPHITGSKEYLMVMRGEVCVSVDGREFVVKTGDVLAFPGDQRHGYSNRRGRPASALSVVLPIPYQA